MPNRLWRRARRLALLGVTSLSIACRPDVSAHRHVSLISGQVLPVYSSVITTYQDLSRSVHPALQVKYETSVPLADTTELKREALAVCEATAPRAEAHGLRALVLSPTPTPTLHPFSVAGFPMPMYTWQWRSFNIGVLRSTDGDWRLDGGNVDCHVTDTARAVATAIDSVQRIVRHEERLVRISPDDQDIVVTVAPMPPRLQGGDVDVHVAPSGRIRSITKSESR